MKFKILLTCVVCLISAKLSADPLGTAFTYQGQLVTDGVSANGTYDFLFKLYTNSATGSLLTYMTVTNVAVTNGIFTTTMDFGAMFNGTAYWLGISVRSNNSGSYVALTPRQPLTPTPNALFASSAANATTASSVTSGSVTAAGIASGQVVKSLNGLDDTVTLAPGNNVTITPSGNTLTIAASGGSQGWSLTGNAGTTPGQNFVGTTDNEPVEFWVNAGRALRLEPGVTGWAAPNVIGGSSFNFVSSGVKGATIAGGGSRYGYSNSVTSDYGTVGGGNLNTASADATVGGGYNNTSSGYTATVGGGSQNHASGESATVGGGYGNSASGDTTTVGGGEGNIASDFYATVGGGYGNSASQQNATVSGGIQNTASGLSATAGGGYYNTASGDFATVGGGHTNIASGYVATVGGGWNNIASGSWPAVVSGGMDNQATNEFATVPGGDNNIAGGVGSFAAGMNAQAIKNGAFVWSDGTANTTSTVNNQFMARASGGFIFYTGSGSSAYAQLAAGATTWTAVSDRNAKKNFQPVDTVAVVDKLAAIPIQQWNYKWENDTDVPNIGPMAQDFKQAFYPGRDDKGISTLEFDGVELAAIQGLNQKVEEKAAKIQEQAAEIQSLKQDMAELKKLVQTIAEKK